MGGMSDYDNSHGYLWFEKQSNAWYEYEDCERGAIVYYWTDADPIGWYDDYNMRRRDEISVAEKDAWAVVERAIEQYEMVKALTKT